MHIISLWHDCVDDNLQSLYRTGTNSNPEHSVEHTLIVCQGYKQDVLDTFPRHLQSSLNKILVKQAYESGYSAYAKHEGLSLPITSVTFDELRRRNSRR